MTDHEIIDAIRCRHLRANIADALITRVYWDDAVVDPGGSIFGDGPYLHVPVDREGEMVFVRVYPPARLRRRLQKAMRHA